MQTLENQFWAYHSQAFEALLPFNQLDRYEDNYLSYDDIHDQALEQTINHFLTNKLATKSEINQIWN